MSTLHPTISDKGRDVGMNEDGEWNVWQVKRVGTPGFDGLIEPNVKPPLAPGDDPMKMRTYYVSVAVSGSVIEEPLTRIDVRLDRYPFDASDNGTAWSYIELTKRVKDGWHGTFGGKIEIYPDGYISNETGRPYSWSVGLGYRVVGGALRIDSRIVKFLRLPDA